jgi:type I restriction enzyme R subunit
LLPEDIDYSNWKGLREGDKVLLVRKALNGIIKFDEPSDTFMLEEKKCRACCLL